MTTNRTINFKLPHLTCRRCGHKWTPRQLKVRQCPSCQSVRWDDRNGEMKKR